MSLRVEFVFEGVSRLPTLPDNTQSLWLRWKVGSHSGETKPALPNKQGNVEWNEMASFKSSFKPNVKADGFERKTLVLTLKGKRNRSTFTLGSVTIDLSQYISEQSNSLHLPFDAGSTSLGATTEFLGKVRVLTPDAAQNAEPLDVSSTLNDDSDDDEDKTNNTDDSFLRNKKFLLTTEEVARKAPLRGGAVSPALQIQGYEEELKEMRRRFAQDKREQESRHQAEVLRLNQQMKTANQESIAKIKALQQDLQRAKEATSSVIVSTLRAQKDEAENQAREKTQTIQSLREQLSDALEKITQFTAVCAKNEANMQRTEKELAMLRDRLKDAENRRRESPEKSMSESALPEKSSVAAAAQKRTTPRGGVSSGGGGGGNGNGNGGGDARSAFGDEKQKTKDTNGEEKKKTALNISSKSAGSDSNRESLSARRRSRPAITLPDVDSGAGSFRLFAISLVIVALAFFVKKVLLK